MNNEITVEMVDQVMERVPNASYKEVREALIKSDGDVVDAIILLEDEKKDPKKIRKDIKDGTVEMIKIGSKEFGKVVSKGCTIALKFGAKIGEKCNDKLNEK